MDKNIISLQESIRNAVKEVICERNIQESKKTQFDMIVEETISKQIKKLVEDKGEKTMTNKKRSVLHWLKQPEVNTAEIRRQLEGEPESQEDEDSKRSYFMKKVNQSHGKDFNDNEINGLYAIKSSLGQ